VVAAEALVRRGLTLRQAHLLMNRLTTNGSAVVELPLVEKSGALVKELSKVGIVARLHSPPKNLDVKAIRKRIGVSQAEFALRYGFDEATVKNWEQGKSSPDTASRTLLKLVLVNPDAVENGIEA